MNPNRGFALMAVAGIVTVTVLQTTSTEIQISANHKQAIQEFYAAEAGLAEARSRLRKTLGTAAAFIGDPRCRPIRCGLPTSWNPQIGRCPSIPSMLRMKRT